MSHEVTLIPGDGIGPEVAYAARRAVDATGVRIDWDISELNAELILKTGKSYRKIADRREAIHQAIFEAGSHDLVLIAGKGHEDYQILGRETFHFDDKEVAREALAQRAGSGERRE